MTRPETAQVVALITAAYGVEFTPEQIAAWHALLGDLDGTVVLEATRRLCLTDNPHPPRPGQVKAEVDHLDGTTPPSIDAAVGLYLSGDWSVHPLVEKAAMRVMWDRVTNPEAAKWQFRTIYEGALFDHDDGTRRPFRTAITAGAQPLAELMAAQPVPPAEHVPVSRGKRDGTPAWTETAQQSEDRHVGGGRPTDIAETAPIDFDQVRLDMEAARPGSEAPG